MKSVNIETITKHTLVFTSTELEALAAVLKKVEANQRPLVAEEIIDYVAHVI